jgi:hypothetical protein
MEKREEIKKYFKPFPKWAVVMIVIGLPLLAAKGLGIVLIGLGIWGLVAWSKKPDDAQMDAWLEEDLKELHRKALSKTGTDVSDLVGEPVMVTGPRFWDVGGAEVAFKKGKDNVLRFTPVDVIVLNFGRDQLVAYQTALDLKTGNALNESTDEYFYKDVVSVSTKTESKTVQFSTNGAFKGGIKGGLAGAIKGSIQLNAAEQFVLTTSGGTHIDVVLRAPELIKQMGGGDIPTTRAEKAIQTVRKMLREKKSVPA